MFNSDNSTVFITPLDLRQAKFPIVMRGFDKAAVTTMLEDASTGYEEALRENERLRQEVARLEGALDQFRDLEGSIKTTLVSAQKLAEDIKANAQQEAGSIVREAEGKAQTLMLLTQTRIEEAQREGEFRDDIGPKEIGTFVNLVLNGLALMRAGGEELPSTALVLTLLRDAIGPDRARTPARTPA